MSRRIHAPAAQDVSINGPILNILNPTCGRAFGSASDDPSNLWTGHQRASCHNSRQGNHVASFPLGADHTTWSLPAATSSGRLAFRLSTRRP